MNPIQQILIFAVRGYRCVLSPAKTAFFGPLGRCRFTPSCSEYALEAVRNHGAVRGGWLALCRVARCHPWADCGHDPVPPTKSRPPGAMVDAVRCGQEDVTDTVVGVSCNHRH